MLYSYWWNNRPMDQIRCLRVFDQVVSQGSFAGAARALDLAPAVVTRCVAELEAHLGARLLNRTTRRLALTEVGATYLEGARQVLAQLDANDALAGSAVREPVGTLRVLCPPAFAVHQLAPVLPQFSARYPRISVELSLPGPLDAADDAFDVSVLSLGSQALQGAFVARPLALSTFVLCASPDYLRRRGEPEHPEDLAQHTGVAPAVSGQRREITLCRRVPDASLALPAEVSVPVSSSSFVTHHIDMTLALALAGAGVAGLPSFVAEQAVRQGRLQWVLPDWRGTVLRLFAAVPARQHLPARTRLFVDFLLERFGGAERDPWLQRLLSDGLA
jgi:DNA-binding transcriptional LysR family regulator